MRNNARQHWHGPAHRQPKGPTALPLAASSAWHWGNQVGWPDVWPTHIEPYHCLESRHWITRHQ
ncbi:hypothetical protein [Providencia rettgeri]|uniref:hypothetical protein n=1 Tax=Providencia rettgeri TaxID=587 RepID=UPI001CF9493C|nr:hypothetical protein [Providencia rettgeri]MCB4816323.1 hypothetical protein [Providencia rettgeri]